MVGVLMAEKESFINYGIALKIRYKTWAKDFKDLKMVLV